MAYRAGDRTIEWLDGKKYAVHPEFGQRTCQCQVCNNPSWIEEKQMMLCNGCGLLAPSMRQFLEREARQVANSIPSAVGWK